MSSTACRPLAGFSLLLLSTQLLAAPAQSIEERLARLEARTSVAETRALVAEADAARLRKEVEQLNKQITITLPVTAQASLNERVARIEANQQSLESPPLTAVSSAHSSEPPSDGFTFS